MRISRKNLLVSLTLVFGLILSNVSLAQSVEFGQDATGDPNAVWVMGASGFLYSDRIVFTAAHTIEYFGSTGYLFAPGVKNGSDNKKYWPQKILLAPTYRYKSFRRCARGRADVGDPRLQSRRSTGHQPSARAPEN